MKPARPLLIVAAALALVITACSQPLDHQSQTAELAPQFGTSGQESVTHAAVNTEGIYLGGSWDGEPGLIKYTRAGRLPWVKFPKPAPGEEAGWLGSGDGIMGVELSAGGHIHVLQIARENTTFVRTYYLSKYAANGSLLWKRRFVTTDFGAASAFTLDGNGNHYVVVQGNQRGAFLYKHNAKGVLLWRKPLPTVSWGYALLATSDGSVYVARRPAQYDPLYQSGLIKYDSAGRQVWERKVPFLIHFMSRGKNGSVHVAGAGFIVDNEDLSLMPSSLKIARYTSSGGVSWRKTVADWTATATQGSSFYLLSLATDAQDSAYVGLQKAKRTPDNFESLLLHKYGSNGARAWSRTFEMRPHTQLRDVAVLNPSEIYLAGDLNLPQADGSWNGDGFLMRLNGQGARVWLR